MNNFPHLFEPIEIGKTKTRGNEKKSSILGGGFVTFLEKML